jgi:ribosome biogenesis protein UTP30
MTAEERKAVNCIKAGEISASGSGAVKSSKKMKEASSSSTTAAKPATSAGLDERLVERAVTALLVHHAESTEQSKDLLGNDAPVQVQFGLEVAPSRAHVKPIPLDIPHPLWKRGECADDKADVPSVCLIVKQESKTEIKDLLERIAGDMVLGGCAVKKVLGLQSLRTNYRDYSQRRDLLRSYDVFMADDRILPMLSGALGKIFFKAKQQPIPVDVTRKSSLPFNVLKALNRTHLSWSRGTCVVVPAGRTDMDARQISQNIVALVPQAVEKFPRKWANLRSVAIKTPSSASLPVYNKTPHELAEIARLSSLKPTWTDEARTSVTPATEASRERRDATLVSSQKDASGEGISGKEKSPLLRALQQQQKMSKTEKRRNDDADGAPAARSDEDPKKTPPSRENKEKKRRSADSSVEPSISKARSGEKANKDRTDAKEPLALKRAKVTSDDGSVREEKRAKSTSPSFVASQKYRGSKRGMVFKMGPKGLGYYLDARSPVDTMALEAILRMASSKSKNKPSSTRHHGKRRGGGGRR